MSEEREQVTARVPPGGAPVFAFDPRPGSTEIAVIASPEEYDAIVGRGWAELDGIRGAVIEEACDPAAGFIRIRLERPWQPAPKELAPEPAKVCAILSWYDESPIWLAATVASLAGVADHLVAVDGAYALFPGRPAASPAGQPAAIMEAAAGARIPLTLHTVGDRWAGNEIEKRNRSFQLALQVANDPSWWLLVIDADERVSINSGGLKTVLTGTELNVAAHGFTEVDDVQRSERLAELARTTSWQKRSNGRRRTLYRANATLRYEGVHCCIRTDDEYLWSNPNVHQVADALDVCMELELEHHHKRRDLERDRQQSHYYRVRDALAIERFIPDGEGATR